MSFQSLLNQLSLAELEFAHFNAHRTCTSADAVIRRASTTHFHYLTDSSRPDSLYYNRAVGRTAGAFDVEAIAELPAAVVAVELRPTEVQPEAVEGLLARGFSPNSSLCYLAALPAPQPRQTQISVTRLDSTQTDSFFDLLESSGTLFPPERRSAKRSFYCTEQFQAFLATDALGVPMGWSTMFLQNCTAFLGNSYTRPEMRARGAHSALLAARLNAAAEAAVDHIFTDVEHGSQSHTNCERAGLRTATINTIWLRRA